MKKSLSLLFLCAALVLPSCEGQKRVKTGGSFNPETFNKIAVIVQQSNTRNDGYYSNVDEALMSQMEDEFTTTLLNKGYDLVSRSALEQIMKEQNLQNSGMNDPSSAAQIGKLANCRAILKVTLQNYKEEAIDPGNPRSHKSLSVNASAQFISVEDAKILWTGSISAKSGLFNNDENLGALVLPLVEAFPPRIPEPAPAQK